MDPTDEEAHLRLITELSGRGDRRSALRQFERLERALRQELGVAPSPAAVTLRARLQEAEGASTEQFSPDRSSSARPPTQPLPLLVGGTADRARLTGLLDTVLAGSGQTVFIAGGAGVGKTALTAWLEHAATERGLRVGTGVAAHIEGAWPYAPVLEALADLCHRNPALLEGLDDELRLEIECGLTGSQVQWAAQGGPPHQRLFVAAAPSWRSGSPPPDRARCWWWTTPSTQTMPACA